MKPNPYQHAVLREHGVFNGRNFSIATDGINWIRAHLLSITEHGQLYLLDELDNHYLLLQLLQLCYVQIYSQGLQRGTTTSESPPVVFIKTYDNERIYISVPSKVNFGNLVSLLIVWQLLRPVGLAKKWYNENRVAHLNASSVPHELLVCRFKVYGPIPAKMARNLNLVHGAPRAPHYEKEGEGSGATSAPEDVTEGWFYTMGVLRSNGVLNFITENDGTLLYSIDIKSVMLLEIRECHHSIFDLLNVLFVGQLKELRFNNVIKTTTTLLMDQYTPPFLTREGRTVSNALRVFIEFPLHIDLEDWLVGLNYFARREYIGSFGFTDRETSIDAAANATKDLTTSGEIRNRQNHEARNSSEVHDRGDGAGALLSRFSRPSFRVSKKLTIDIIEAKFDRGDTRTGHVYAEVRMWGLPWSRTAVVPFTQNPFWKEEFATDLPISTQMVHILIKRAAGDAYSTSDKVVGTVFVTPDILTRLLRTSSTIMGAEGGPAQALETEAVASAPGNDIVRLAIYDLANIPVGKLLLNVRLKEYHILGPSSFRALEKMLMNAPMKDLIPFCNDNVPTSDFEYVSVVLLDIFQSLGIEDKWFKELMEAELVNVDKMTRKNYVQRGSNAGASSSLNNVFNTLFRGSSIFSKSLEKYNLRIGQEYLEKVFGDFFAKVSHEGKDCEIDPRYVALAVRKRAKGDEDLDTDDLDSEYDSDEERERDAQVKATVEQNFKNLYGYAEEIWNKIYVTSNDLPEQIKLQLKNFRTKVELACDPEDKTTALNCLSAFIFLRFFCPAILNPKLFYLTKNHQTGSAQRTLTLIAKILLNLANRLDFSPHKEPHLVPMNKFLEAHQPEIYDYFDKITGRKNDFNEKILDLSHEVKRFDLGLGEDAELSELPTTPYLIDKYLRLTELIHLLDSREDQSTLYDVEGRFSGSFSPNAQSGAQGGAPAGALAGPSARSSLQNGRVDEHTAGGEVDDSAMPPLFLDNFDIRLNLERDVYQIGSLEFEKSEFLDLAGDNETEGFIKLLCRSNENIFSFISSNITLKDLQKESSKLLATIHDLEEHLEGCEYPKNYLSAGYVYTNSINYNGQPPQADAGREVLWEAFANDILSKLYLDLSRNCLVLLDREVVPSSGYKKIVEQNALNGLKLRFVEQNVSSNGHDTSTGSSGLMSLSFSDSSLGSIVRTKNPFKKWLRK